MGQAYLVVDNRKARVFKEFISKAKEAPMLVLSRDPPSRLKSFFSGKDFRHLWLTNTQVEFEHVRPQDLEQLSYAIERFITQNKKSAVLVAGVEFVISYTSFDQTIHLLQTMRDLAIISDCLLLVNIGVGTLSGQQEHLLEQELEALKVSN